MSQEERLIEEYRLAQEYNLSLNSHTWHIATIMIVAAFGTFAIVSSFDFDNFNVFTLGISILAASASIAFLWIWYSIMNRHDLFIQITYFRMREIETQLGLWKTRYVFYIDNIQELDGSNLSDAEKEHVLQIWNEQFKDKIPNFRSRELLKFLIIFVGFAWIFWIIIQVYMIFF